MQRSCRNLLRPQSQSNRQEKHDPSEAVIMSSEFSLLYSAPCGLLLLEQRSVFLLLFVGIGSCEGRASSRSGSVPLTRILLVGGVVGILLSAAVQGASDAGGQCLPNEEDSPPWR